MKNFKNLALAALTFVATVAPTAIAPAQAGAFNNLTTGQKELIVSIKRQGVDISASACKNDGSYGYFSYYSGTWRDAKIQICTNVATSQADQWETLRHEAVHVAQKCENRDHGNTFRTLSTASWLKKYGSESDAAFITRAYPKAKWGIEFEAFTLQKYSNQTIANIVNKACN